MGRTAGMSLNPLTWPEIESWSRLYGVRLASWELDAIACIDAAYRKVMGEKES